jgi:hypothetical protein
LPGNTSHSGKQRQRARKGEYLQFHKLPAIQDRRSPLSGFRHARFAYLRSIIPYPLITPRGRSCATRRARPAS